MFIFVEVEDEHRAPARDRAQGGADHARLRVDPRAGPRGTDRRRGARRADDYPLTLGLTEAVSPLRIRGMTGLLGRTQRQVRDKTAA